MARRLLARLIVFVIVFSVLMTIASLTGLLNR